MHNDNMNFETSEYPSELTCRLVNPQLYRYFQKAQQLQNGSIANLNWSEAEVIQWLDLELDESVRKILDLAQEAN